MQSNLTLRQLGEDDEEEFLRAHRAASSHAHSFLRYYEAGMAFRRYLEVLAEQERGVNLPSALHVPTTFLFAFVGPTIVGRASIRHTLNESLERKGGHIGYVVLPEFRRRGYATAILRSSLEVAREKCDTRRLLVTCDDDNIGSIKAIERNGGVLGDIISDPDLGKPLRRYWIDLR